MVALVLELVAARYLVWVSAAEWEYGRVTVAWIRPGPSPARTRATARAPVARLANQSRPSTLVMARPRKPRTISEIGAVAWSSERTEIA